MKFDRKEALSWGDLPLESLSGVIQKASDIRDTHWGRYITYSRKVFIPLTNMCRDTCGYCVFVQHPSKPAARYLTPDEVLKIADDGLKMGCKEALFSLGEKPELRYPEARTALDNLGYTSTVDYLVDMSKLVFDRTGLIPHSNAGALDEDDLRKLRPVCGSMGMMIENVSTRLMQKGNVHYKCPDKHPRTRLRTLEAAGRLNIPFTTGILIGIGETWEERLDSLIAIQNIFDIYGTVQEVIIQNFRSKKGIPSESMPEPGLEDMMKTIAAARVILDPDISIQAPPNLESNYIKYIDAGLNDWGGVSPVTIDHINPERAWPQITELRSLTESAGYKLQERLTVYPKFLKQRTRFLDSTISLEISKMARTDGLAEVQSTV